MKTKLFKNRLLLQFIKFCIVGISNTAVSYVVNLLTLKMLKPYAFSKDYMIANTIAFILSILWSFYWNNRFTFATKPDKISILKMLLKAYIAYAFTGIIVNNILSYIWIDMLLIPKTIAPLINSIIGIPVNFLTNKFWVFSENKN